MREQALLYLSGDLQLAIHALALRDFAGNGLAELTVLERQSGLAGHRLEQVHVRFRVRLLGAFRAQAHEADQLLLERQG